MPETAIAEPAAPPAAGPGERTSMRLLGLVGGAVLVLLAGFGLGRISSGGSGPDGAAPVVTASPVHTDAPGVAPHTHAGMTGGGGTGTTVTGTGIGDVGGLALGTTDFRLVPVESAFATPGKQRFQFRIAAADGTAITKFAVVHDKLLHLIVVRRDLTGYQHLHPEMAPDGTWSTEVDLATAGTWRAYADFTASTSAGAQVAATLGVDLAVGGAYAHQPIPGPQPKVTVDGLEVEFGGAPAITSTQPLIFTVRRGGAVAPVERYLGAFGHLVVLREGDLGYVHVHPEDQLTGDGGVKFWLAAPSPGRYRAFFDFQVDGVVRTAAYTIEVS